MKHGTTENHTADLDWDRLAEGLRQHLEDITTALTVIDRIRAWSMPQEVAGASTLSSHGGTLDPTGLGAGKTVTASAYALLHNAGRPMQISEMVETLMASGVTTRSGNFENCLNALLSKRRDMFDHISPKTWGLLEWKTNLTPTSPTRKSRQGAVVTPFRPKGQP